MNTVVHDVLCDRSGGPNRRRILCTLEERPRNTHQLARALDLNYKTVNHHLSILLDENLVRKSGEQYGAVYLPTDHARHHWDAIEALARSSESPSIK
ncbi:MAG TPA: winged helix-turn-helix domain-containing protein [Halococcus sp.]|nr:winged helix-turn-helix domain-containing protein [Halococcus sp.]